MMVSIEKKIKRLVLSDEMEIVRIGLTNLLKKQPDFQVIAEASGGGETMAKCMALQPDAVIIGLDSKKNSAIIQGIAQAVPQTSIVIYAQGPDDDIVKAVRAFQSGAQAYVLKDSPATELVHAINEASNGRRYLDSYLQSILMEDQQQAKIENIFHHTNRLTNREQEILDMVSRGLTSIKIAKQLGISSRTVEYHRSQITQKLGLRRPAVNIGLYAQLQALTETFRAPASQSTIGESNH